MRAIRGLIVFTIVAIITRLCLADGGQITVSVDKPGAKIGPMLYGLMTEEINHAYDGGLYAELIQNRTFQDGSLDLPPHWSVVKSGSAQGSIALTEKDPVNDEALKRSLVLNTDSVAAGERIGAANDGFWGIPVWPSTKYRVSFYARADDGFSGPLTLDIESAGGQTTFATTQVSGLSKDWSRFDATLTTADVPVSTENRFVISASAKGAVYLSLVSLFPPTFNNRLNGNRIDLMQKMLDMHPAFLRLPGGNYLEGNTIDSRFAWKKTLGDLDHRPGHQGPWGYRSTDGLGLLEYLQWCEDLKVEPLLAVFAGYALEGAHVDPGPKLQPFVDEALDEIEYCTGDSSTRWGGQREADGHPAAFKIRYIEIGNEDMFDHSGSYDGRFAQFFDAIKAKYPDLKCIATAKVKSRVPDLVDDHYYMSARQMEVGSHHYDPSRYPRTGPKVFVGEWATQEGGPTPDMNAAVADATWLTGLERNADVVEMSCYAPLLVNVNPGAWQWKTNLIGYNAVTSFGSPSYYAQKMFNENRGDRVLPVEISVPPVPVVDSPPTGGIGVATWGTSSEFKDIEVSQGGKILYQSDFAGGMKGWRPRGRGWTVADGALRQTGMGENQQATTGAGWGDYTYRVKARKIEGSEGFIVMFHVVDRDNFLWWNVGGWGDTQSAVEQSVDGGKEQIGDAAPVTVDANRWYNLRVEVKGHDIKCFLDDQLVNHVVEAPPGPVSTIYATASRMDENGDVVLKVVNAGKAAQSLMLNLHGAASVDSTAKATVLTGNPTDVNSIYEPAKVSPRELQLSDAGSSFTHEFPPCSVTVLRFKVH
jgi:alpha-L-arabinofuranosidase